MRKLTFILSLLLVAAACGTGDPVAPSARSTRPARDLESILGDTLPPPPADDSTSTPPSTTGPNGDGGIMIGGGG